MFESEEMIGCHSCMNEDEFDTEKEPCKSCQGMSNYVSKRKKIAENHIEYLIDFDSNKDIVSSVSNVHVMTTENKKE